MDGPRRHRADNRSPTPRTKGSSEHRACRVVSPPEFRRPVCQTPSLSISPEQFFACHRSLSDSSADFTGVLAR